jgi:hypothetical protein
MEIMVFLRFAVFGRKVGQGVDVFQNAGYIEKYRVIAQVSFRLWLG